jgi:hypothetical protein
MQKRYLVMITFDGSYTGSWVVATSSSFHSMLN